MNTEFRIFALLKELTEFQKLRLVDFLEDILGQKARKSPQNLLRFAGAIPQEDLQLIQNSISEDCNNIDEDEW